MFNPGKGKKYAEFIPVSDFCFLISCEVEQANHSRQAFYYSTTLWVILTIFYRSQPCMFTDFSHKNLTSFTSLRGKNHIHLVTLMRNWSSFLTHKLLYMSLSFYLIVFDRVPFLNIWLILPGKLEVHCIIFHWENQTFINYSLWVL